MAEVQYILHLKLLTFGHRSKTLKVFSSEFKGNLLYKSELRPFHVTLLHESDCFDYTMPHRPE